MERHECFFVKRREIGQKKTGKSCFLQMRLWLLYKVLVRFRYGEKVTKNMLHIRFVVKIKSKSQSCSGDAFHRGVKKL